MDDSLIRALNSVRVQRVKDFEVVIGWNGVHIPEESPLWALANKTLTGIRWVTSSPGAGAARNAAIDFSHGQYLVFLDADDELQPGALTVLASQITRHPVVDVIHYSAFDRRSGARLVEPSWYLSRARLARNKIELGQVVENRRAMIEHFSLVSPAPWLRCVKKTLVVDSNLSFQNLTNVNDLYFFIALMSSSHHALFLDRRLVVYSRNQPESASNRRFEAASNVVEALRSSKELIESNSYRGSFANEYSVFAVGQLISFWSHMAPGLKLELWRLVRLDAVLRAAIRQPRQTLAFVLLTLGFSHYFVSAVRRIVGKISKP